MKSEDHVCIGIDLGTTNSLVAYIKDGDPRIIPNERGDRMTPSVVYFREDGQIMVGEMAKNQAVLNSDRTIREVKLSMGSDRIFTVGGETFTPVDVSALILKKLRENAEHYLGKPVRDAVITVPAYFDDNQREDTIRAAEIAGIKVLKLLNEPTAAALTYGLGNGAGARLMVIDLGGGTFDITLMEYSDSVFRVRGVGGSTSIGGTDFDQKIVEYIRNRFIDSYGIDLSHDRIAMQQLVIHSEKAKVDLSSAPETRIMIPYITITEKGPVHLNETLSRTTFEQLIDELLKQIEQQTTGTFEQAVLTPEWVDTVIMVGGSTRIPAVERLVAGIIGNHDSSSAGSSGNGHACDLIRRSINPDEAVARGAGILAGILEGSMTDIEFHDMTPHDLGVEDDNGNFVNILPRGTIYPAEAYRLFTTTSDHQEEVYIHVLQQKDDAGDLNVSLGWFRLKTDSTKNRGEPEIDVTFAIDANGVLKVSAMELDSGELVEIVIENRKADS